MADHHSDEEERFHSTPSCILSCQGLPYRKVLPTCCCLPPGSRWCLCSPQHPACCAWGSPLTSIITHIVKHCRKLLCSHADCIVFFYHYVTVKIQFFKYFTTSVILAQLQLPHESGRKPGHIKYCYKQSG